MTTPIVPPAHDIPIHPVVVLLTETRSIIADPARWTQGVGARDAVGNPCDPWAKQATCWCLLGALLIAARRLNIFIHSQFYDHARELLEQQMSENLISRHNDDPETAHADVLDKLDHTIAVAQAHWNYATGPEGERYRQAATPALQNYENRP